MKYILTTLTLALTAVTVGHARLATTESIATTTPDGRAVTVTAITPNILKVTNMAPGEQPLPSRATVPQISVEKPVIMSPGEFTTTLTTSAGVTAIVDDRTGTLVITAGPGKVITDSGLRRTAGGKCEIRLATTATGSFYGAGERGHKLNLRGDTLVMFNRQNYGYTGSDPRISQMNITMPLFLASDGFAVLFDDYARGEMVLGNPVTYITENPRPVTYYFVNGARTLADVTESLSGLTGRQPLPPLWSLGYITSKYGYHDRAETEGVVDTLKRAGYPLDGIVLDLYWYGKEQDMGRLAWDPGQWPDPEAMLRRLKQKGVNLIPISQPYVLRNGRALDNYNELSSRGLLLKDSTGGPQEVEIWVGEGGMFDLANPDTRAWLTDRYKSLTDMGIAGWWGDLGEPEVHPLTGIHANGQSAALYHNQYGNDWSETVYEMFRKYYPQQRPLSMMRGGTTGLQRYGVFPWSTDVSRSWGGLEPQVRIMLNSGLSGLGYMGHDVGGFAVEEGKERQPELYVRWLQLGLFSPMLRTHAQQLAEPYHYPEYASIIEPIIKERYRWLPYNYTLAYENAAKGWPLVRPLNFTEPGAAYDSISDEFLWGDEVLVAPVMADSVTERDVTFPAGQWVDMSAPCRVYAGHSTVTYPAPLEVLPLFVRAGAFIPMAEYKMENTGDYDPARLTVRYYPVEGGNSSYTMYDDDRVSPTSLADGKYRLVKFEGSDSGRRVTVSAEGTYPGAKSTVELTLVYCRAAGPAAFRVNGRNMKASYDARNHTLTLRLKWPVGRPLNIESKNLTLCSQE